MAGFDCHNCNFSQDDFWDKEKEGYSPFRPELMEDLRKMLFEDRVYFDKFVLEDFDLPILQDEKGYYAIGTEFVARKLELKAKSIRNMKVRTNEEWEEVKASFVCPECGCLQ